MAFFTVSPVKACQEKQTPQEMLFQGCTVNLKEKDKSKRLELEKQALKEEGVDVNFKYYYGNTALFGAAFNGDEEIVKLLLNFNADPNI